MTVPLAARLDACRHAGPVYVWASGLTDWGRDPDVWPRLLGFLQSLPAGVPAVAWSAGCATGEEPYTLAMRTANWPHPPRIVATDVHAEAVEAARRGRYPAVSCRPPWMPADLTRHITYGPRWAMVAARLRQRVEFVRHDLLDGPAVDRVGVLLLRNVLHMLTPDRVPGVLAVVSRCLVPGGRLVVGRSDLQVPHIRAILDGWGKPSGHPMLYRSRWPGTHVRPSRIGREIRSVRPTHGRKGVCERDAGSGPAVPGGRVRADHH